MNQMFIKKELRQLCEGLMLQHLFSLIEMEDLKTVPSKKKDQIGGMARRFDCN